MWRGAGVDMHADATEVDLNAVAPSVDLHADATEVDVIAVAPSVDTHADATNMEVLAKARAEYDRVGAVAVWCLSV